jgi:tetratricopeptide (TPR) repeat protein
MSTQGAVKALNAAQAQQAQQALRLLQSGQAAAALGVARALVAAAPRAPDALQLQAMCAADAGVPDEADAAFKAALANSGGHPLIQLNYGNWLRRVRRLDEAAVAFESATRAMPANGKAWLELGQTRLEAKHYAPARIALERAVALLPTVPAAWQAYGSSLRGLDELDAATAAFERTVALAPKSQTAYYNLGAVHRLSGRGAAAVSAYEQAAKLGPMSAELGEALAGALLDAGRVDEAFAGMREVVRADPGSASAHSSLAQLLWEYGPRHAPGEDPLGVFREALAARPRDTHLRAAFARFLVSARQLEPALSEIRTLRAQLDRPEFATMEANTLELMGRHVEAGALYEQVHRAWGAREPAFLNAYARHLMSAGKADLAAAELEQATRIDPRNMEAWANLGTAWRLLDDPREHWLCDYANMVGVLDVEPPAGLSLDAFLADLRATLEPLHQAGREPLRQSLRAGSQTPGKLFGRTDPAIVAAREALKRTVEAWIATLPEDPSHPFLSRKAPSIRFSGSWSVRLWSSGKHVNHIHPEGWMSSAFYVALPPSLGTAQADGSHAGYIQFGKPPDELALGLEPRRVVRPEPGRLALFPSYFWHGTVPFEDAAPRLTIAFDMVPDRPA